MRIADVKGDSPLLDSVYHEVLQPSFNPDQLEACDFLRTSLDKGLAVVSALVDDEGRPMAAAVGEWSPEIRVLLLAYIAVRSDLRSGGLGSRLMREVAHSWQDRFHPQLTLVEIEHPLVHQHDGAYGDSAARLRFYARHGARVLDLPYFQPALRPGSERIYGMLLAALHVTSEAVGDRPENVGVGPVRAFLVEYLLNTEGAVPDDPAVTRLWQALDRPGGVPLLPVADPAVLPLSRPG